MKQGCTRLTVYVTKQSCHSINAFRSTVCLATVLWNLRQGFFPPYLPSGKILSGHNWRLRARSSVYKTLWSCQSWVLPNTPHLHTLHRALTDLKMCRLQGKGRTRHEPFEPTNHHLMWFAGPWRKPHGEGWVSVSCDLAFRFVGEGESSDCSVRALKHSQVYSEPHHRGKT